MTGNTDIELRDAEGRWFFFKQELAQARPLSQDDRAKVFQHVLTSALSERRAAWIYVGLACILLPALGYLMVGALPGMAGWHGAVFGFGCVAIAVTSFGRTDALPALYSTAELRDNAERFAYPRLANGDQLDEVKALVDAVPDLLPIVQDWLEQGPLSTREYDDLMRAKRLHDRVVALREQDARRQSRTAELQAAATNT